MNINFFKNIYKEVNWNKFVTHTWQLITSNDNNIRYKKSINLIHESSNAMLS